MKEIINIEKKVLLSYDNEGNGSFYKWIWIESIDEEIGFRLDDDDLVDKIRDIIGYEEKKAKLTLKIELLEEECD